MKIEYKGDRMHKKVVVKTLGEVTDDELCSVDVEYTHASLVALMVAHNAGDINIEDNYWFGPKESYAFAPKSAPTMVLKEI